LGKKEKRERKGRTCLVETLKEGMPECILNEEYRLKSEGSVGRRHFIETVSETKKREWKDKQQRNI
jgi:hypothetical protein